MENKTLVQDSFSHLSFVPVQNKSKKKLIKCCPTKRGGSSSVHLAGFRTWPQLSFFFCQPMYYSRQHTPRQNITCLHISFSRKLREWERLSKSLTTIYTSVRTTAKLSWGLSNLCAQDACFEETSEDNTGSPTAPQLLQAQVSGVTLGLHTMYRTVPLIRILNPLSLVFLEISMGTVL